MNETMLVRLTKAKEWLKQNPPKNPPIIGIHCTRWPVHIEKCYKTRKEVAYATRVL